MRRTALSILAALAALPLFAVAQQERKPYAGEERRQIKSLSDEEVAAYLKGEGMGLAKPAELNSYPGPRHVLDLSDQLRLSAAQREATSRVYDEMRAEAVRLGRLIVERERALDALFARAEIDEAKLDRATAEISRLQGSLRSAHLRAHLAVKRLLTPEQVRNYDALRGYNSEGQPAPKSDGQHKRVHH